mmetsp:Transcript_4139/g.15597  ORF Transcript_4139/g.15597 Transcript_4139/m.15597 type:complete len:103 (+) Transcript_4139:310-618(+)
MQQIPFSHPTNSEEPPQPQQSKHAADIYLRDILDSSLLAYYQENPLEFKCFHPNRWHSVQKAVLAGARFMKGIQCGFLQVGCCGAITKAAQEGTQMAKSAVQ